MVAVHPIRRWLLSHRGVLSRVAKEHEVSPQYVQRIIWGKAWDSLRREGIERSLRAEGWPDASKVNVNKGGK